MGLSAAADSLSFGINLELSLWRFNWLDLLLFVTIVGDRMAIEGFGVVMGLLVVELVVDRIVDVVVVELVVVLALDGGDGVTRRDRIVVVAFAMTGE